MVFTRISDIGIALPSILIALVLATTLGLIFVRAVNFDCHWSTLYAQMHLQVSTVQTPNSISWSHLTQVMVIVYGVSYAI